MITTINDMNLGFQKAHFWISWTIGPTPTPHNDPIPYKTPLCYHWPPSLYRNQIPRKLIASFNLLPEILSRDLPLDQIFPTPLKKIQSLPSKVQIFTLFLIKSFNLHTFPHPLLYFSSSCSQNPGFVQIWVFCFRSW